MAEMKTLTLNGVTYEIVDAKARDWIGDLDQLTTEEKSSLVAAINEAAQSGGGTVDAAEVERIVQEYLEANPPTAGKDGADGADGEDGVSPTVSVELIDSGYRITITDVNGTKTFDIMNGADGKDGIDGYTPVKGEDYFTQEEIAEIAQQAADLVDTGSAEIESLDAEKVVFSEDLLTTMASW